jgi:hypothetical protein
MHQVTREEELSHIYQLALDFCAKLSLRSRDEIGQIRMRFQVAALAETPESEDGAALRLLDRICQAYQND